MLRARYSTSQRLWRDRSPGIWGLGDLGISRSTIQWLWKRLKRHGANKWLQVYNLFSTITVWLGLGPELQYSAGVIFYGLHTLHGQMHNAVVLTTAKFQLVSHYNQYSLRMSVSKTELLCNIRVKGNMNGTLRSWNAVCHICASITAHCLPLLDIIHQIYNFTNTITWNPARWRHIDFTFMTSRGRIGQPPWQRTLMGVHRWRSWPPVVENSHEDSHESSPRLAENSHGRKLSMNLLLWGKNHRYLPSLREWGPHLIHLGQPHLPVTTPNSIPIQSAVLPQYTLWTDRLTDRSTERCARRQVCTNTLLCCIYRL